MSRAFSSAADSNRHAILDALRHELASGDRVLEIGSGTGQHACHFAAHLPDVLWQPSDLPAALPGMRDWLAEADCPNLLEPLALDVNADSWPALSASVCYTANTFHIIDESGVASLIAGCARVLGNAGKLCVYGPFHFDGQAISESNTRFSEALQRQDPAMGVRDVVWLNAIARQHAFQPARAIALPSNNHLLVFDR